MLDPPLGPFQSFLPTGVIRSPLVRIICTSGKLAVWVVVVVAVPIGLMVVRKASGEQVAPSLYILVDRLQHLEPSVSSGNDCVWIRSPNERLCTVRIVFSDKAIDGGLQIDQRMKDAVLQAAACQFGEEAFHSIQP